jgi:hypothetical protein
MVAYDYPLLGIFWTTLWLFLVIGWFWVLFVVIADIFRNDEANGWVKALWVIFIIVLPLLGVLVYVLVNGNGMTRRKIANARARDAAARSYIQDAAAPANAADQFAQLAQLHAQGTLDDAEFAAAKAKILG